ncbi:MAG: hypothetical protein ACM3X6_06710 [Patescibacteria group bacterium]
MFILNFLAKIISTLHFEGDPRGMAAGFALGAILGLTHLLSLHNLVAACLILLLDVGISAALLGMAVYGLRSWIRSKACWTA